MNQLNLHVGSRIRLYRRMKNYTITELAGRIHKSKATLSKYETGDITVDVGTLFDIASVLDVRVQQLLDYTPPAPRPTPQGVGGFFPQPVIYLYFYDGRVNRIVRSLLEIGGESGENTATLYNDVADFRLPGQCRSLYFGAVHYYDTFTNFSLNSQSNRIEQMTLCSFNPFDRCDWVLGMLVGLSRSPMLPVSIKCILSPAPLEENEELKNLLLLSKQDMSLIRKLNMFAVEQLR